MIEIVLVAVVSFALTFFLVEALFARKCPPGTVTVDKERWQRAQGIYRHLDGIGDSYSRQISRAWTRLEAEAREAKEQNERLLEALDELIKECDKALEAVKQDQHDTNPREGLP